MSLFCTPLFWLFLFLPTQLGRHFWLEDSLVLGRRIDYLSPTIFFTDLFIVAQIIFVFKNALSIKQLQKTIFINFIAILLGLVVWGFNLLNFYFLLRTMLLICFAWSIKATKPQIKDILLPLSLGIIFEVVLTTAQFLTQSSIGGWWYFLGERSFSTNTPGIAQTTFLGKFLLRPYATFPHPNVLGGYLAALLPFFSINFIEQKTKPFEYMMIKTAKVLLVLGIFLSFSRSAWFVAVFMLGSRVFYKSKINLKLKYFLSLIIFLLLFTCLFTYPGFIVSQPVLERISLSIAALKMIGSAPFLGVGLGEFIRQLPQFLAPPFLLQPVHNVYLLIIAETGALGVVLIFVIARFLKKFWYKQDLNTKLAVVSVLFLGLVDHYFLTIQQTRVLLFFIIGQYLINVQIPKKVKTG